MELDKKSYIAICSAAYVNAAGEQELIGEIRDERRPQHRAQLEEMLKMMHSTTQLAYNVRDRLREQWPKESIEWDAEMNKKTF